MCIRDRAMQMVNHMLDTMQYPSVGTYLRIKEKNPNVMAWYADKPYAWKDPCPYYLAINTEIYPWSLKEVRWAMAYAIDQANIAEVSFEGATIASPHLFPLYGGLVENYLSKITDLLAKYNATEYDPERAEEIFASLGFTKGSDGIWVTPNGTRLELTIVTTTPWIELKKWTMQVAEYLQDVGIDTVVKLLEYPVYADAVSAGEYPAMAIWACGSTFDPLDDLKRYYSRWWYRPTGNVTGGWNDPERWRNSTYDDIVEKMMATSPDDPNYVKYFRDAMRIWLEELPGIPIVQTSCLTIVDTTYWTGWPNATNNYMHPLYQMPQVLFIIAHLRSRPPAPEQPAPAQPVGISPWLYVGSGIVVGVIIGAIVILAVRRKH